MSTDKEISLLSLIPAELHPQLKAEVLRQIALDKIPKPGKTSAMFDQVMAERKKEQQNKK